MKELVKGQLDWHETINENMKELENSIAGAGTDLTELTQSVTNNTTAIAENAEAIDRVENGMAVFQTTIDSKLDKPSSTGSLTEGYVYQELDGSVTLKPDLTTQPSSSTSGTTSGGDDEYEEIIDGGSAEVPNFGGTQSLQSLLSESSSSTSPTSSTLGEGYIFKKSDGTTILRPGIEPEPDPFIYTITIDNNSTTSTTEKSITYFDDCASFTRATGSDLGSWADTDLVKKYFRPCVIRAGEDKPLYYLQQDNRNLKEDGTPANVDYTNGEDVMIEVKKLYYKVSSVYSTHTIPTIVGDGTTSRQHVTKFTISISNIKQDDTWMCFNNLDGEDRDVVYIGAYLAGAYAPVSESGGVGSFRLFSAPGIDPAVGESIKSFRSEAIVKGGMYCLFNISMLFLLQCMYLLLYKDKDSQDALGYGYVSYSNTAPANTGRLNEKPFCYGGSDGVVFLGVEDFYGNLWQMIDGMRVHPEKLVEWNVSGVGVVKSYIVTNYYYTHKPSVLLENNYVHWSSVENDVSNNYDNDAYLRCVKGSSVSDRLCFLPGYSGSKGGSSNAWWSDKFYISGSTDNLLLYGGMWSMGTTAGAFCYNAVNDWVTGKGTTMGVRLCRYK